MKMKTLNYRVFGAALLIVQFGTMQTTMAESKVVENTIVNVVDQAFTAAIRNRPAMTIEIVDRLREEAETKGLDGWEKELTSKLNNVSDEAFLAAYNAGDDYKSVAAALAGISFDKKALVNNLTIGGGAPAALLGSPDKDFVYTPFPPCRLVNTRTAGGKINAGDSRGFHANGGSFAMTSQGGHAGGCLVNGGSDVYGGYVLNITVTQPEGNGHLRVYAEGDPLPPASILNYTTGQTIANSVVVKGAYLAGYDFRIYTSSKAHVIVDVMGSFDKPESTMPETIVVRSATLHLNHNVFGHKWSPNCPSGYRLTSGGMDVGNYNVNMIASYPNPSTTGANAATKWGCRGWNTHASNDGASMNFSCFALCSKIPGK